MSHRKVLAFIEVLLESFLGIILELIAEGVVYGIQYVTTEVIINSIKSAGDGIESIADEADKRPGGVICSLILSGIIAGSLISFTFPERIINFGSITGISLLVTPLIMGLLSSIVGRWEKKHDRAPTFMATFLGGAIFGLAAAGTRLIFITQMQT